MNPWQTLWTTSNLCETKFAVLRSPLRQSHGRSSRPSQLADLLRLVLRTTLNCYWYCRLKGVESSIAAPAKKSLEIVTNQIKNRGSAKTP